MEKKFESNTFTLFKVGAACSNEPMRKTYITEGIMRIIQAFPASRKGEGRCRMAAVQSGAEHPAFTS